jgi:hypothetical protein
LAGREADHGKTVVENVMKGKIRLSQDPYLTVAEIAECFRVCSDDPEIQDQVENEGSAKLGEGLPEVGNNDG